VRGRTTAPAGTVLGHEITGEVIDKGSDVEMIALGDLVSVPLSMVCSAPRGSGQGHSTKRWFSCRWCSWTPDLGCATEWCSHAPVTGGSTGEVVKSLQQVLTVGGPRFWNTVPNAIDGSFGLSTKASVRAFQTWAGVTADGIVGDQTWGVQLGAAGATLESQVGLQYAT
jgi:hypothetical protein